MTSATEDDKGDFLRVCRESLTITKQLANMRIPNPYDHQDMSEFVVRMQILSGQSRSTMDQHETLTNRISGKEYNG